MCTWLADSIIHLFVKSYIITAETDGHLEFKKKWRDVELEKGVLYRIQYWYLSQWKIKKGTISRYFKFSLLHKKETYLVRIKKKKVVTVSALNLRRMFELSADPVLFLPATSSKKFKLKKI